MKPPWEPIAVCICGCKKRAHRGGAGLCNFCRCQRYRPGLINEPEPREEPLSREPHKMARRADPASSKVSAEEAEASTAKADRAKILAKVQERPGLTSTELDLALDTVVRHPSGRRLPELREKYLVFSVARGTSQLHWYPSDFDGGWGPEYTVLVGPQYTKECRECERLLARIQELEMRLDGRLGSPH